MSDDSDVAMGCLAVSVGTVLWVIGFPWYAFVTTKLWGWFAVPFGLPAIGFWWAMGFKVLVSHLAPSPIWPDEEGDWKRTGRVAAVALLVPALTLLIGWGISTQMPS